MLRSSMTYLSLGCLMAGVTYSSEEGKAYTGCLRVRQCVSRIGCCTMGLLRPPYGGARTIRATFPMEGI